MPMRLRRFEIKNIPSESSNSMIESQVSYWQTRKPFDENAERPLIKQAERTGRQLNSYRRIPRLGGFSTAISRRIRGQELISNRPSSADASELGFRKPYIPSPTVAATYHAFEIIRTAISPLQQQLLRVPASHRFSTTRTTSCPILHKSGTCGILLSRRSID